MSANIEDLARLCVQIAMYRPPIIGNADREDIMIAVADSNIMIKAICQYVLYTSPEHKAKIEKQYPNFSKELVDSIDSFCILVEGKSEIKNGEPVQSIIPTRSIGDIYKKYDDFILYLMRNKVSHRFIAEGELKSHKAGTTVRLYAGWSTRDETKVFVMEAVINYKTIDLTTAKFRNYLIQLGYEPNLRE